LHYVADNNPPICYAGWASDELRFKSSSGGAFSLFAQFIVKQGGKVYGASYLEGIEVCHIGVDNLQDIDYLRKSKYVQSNMKEVFKDVKEELGNGRIVLFSGCPCQVAGLYAFLGEKPHNLYTIDIICKGVPSQKIFSDYVQCYVDLNLIKKIDFRNKEKGWNADWITIEKNDGETIELQAKGNYRKEDYNWYTRSFLDNIIVNEACFDCHYASIPRTADITLGDFWGIWEHDMTWFDKKGTSLILCNSEKGKQFFTKIESGFVRVENKPFSLIEPYNRFRNQIVKNKSNNERFRELVKSGDLIKAFKYASKEQYDVGIVGTWNVGNQGASLLCLALYKYITDLGYSVLMIGQHGEANWQPSDRVQFFKDNPYPEYAISKKYNRKRDMKELNSKCNMFLLSSDQLLYKYFYDNYGQCFALDWTYENKKRIAYGASFTAENPLGSDFDIAEMSHYLQRFDHFSVREDRGIYLTRNVYGVEAQKVLDPVFLCDVSLYEELAQKEAISLENEEYCLSCIWHPEKKKMDAILDYISQKQIKLINVAEAGVTKRVFDEYGLLETEYETTVEKWLAYIKNATMIITDSFHVVCMSIIFKKKFVVIASDAPGRIKTLLEAVGLENRIVKKCDAGCFDIIRQEIDYDKVFDILNEKIEFSRNWLKNALQSNKFRCSVSDFDILDNRCDRIMGIINEKKLPEIMDMINVMKEEKKLMQNDIDSLKEIKQQVNELKQTISNMELLIYKLSKVFDGFSGE